MVRSATKPRFPSRLRIALALGLAALGLFLACNVDNSAGTPVTELKFQVIADSLQTAGYDGIQISVTRANGSDSSSLYKGVLAQGTKIGIITLPDSLGKSYRIIVQATKASDPGLLFTKTYVIVDGVIATNAIVVIPGTSGGPPAPTGVVIEADYLNLADGGDSAPLVAQVLPFPKAKQDVAWSSSNAAVATVSNVGLVVSGAVGTAKITATAGADATKSASIEVTVSTLQQVDSVVVDPHTLRYFLGMPKSPLTMRMVPASAPALVAWSSSNQAVATVSVDGKVTGQAVGSAYVRAKFKGDAAIGDSCKVTVVKDPPILNVGQDISVAVGATVDFPVAVTQEFGGIAEFKWTLLGDTNAYATATSVPTGLSHTYPAAGDFTAIFSARDSEGNVTVATRLVRVGSAAPLVVITSPVDGTTTSANTIAVAWTVDGVAQTAQLSDSLAVEGENTITREATDSAGHKGTASVKVIRNGKAPVVAITSPSSGTYTNKTSIAVAWSVDGVAQITKLSDSLAVEGENTITREFTNAANVKGSATVKVIRDTKLPVVIITSPADGTIINKGTIAVAWTVDGVAQTAQLTDSLAVEGLNTITRSFTDSAGNKGTIAVKVTRDSKAPVVAIAAPVAGFTTNKTSVTVAWSIDGVAQTTLLTDSLPLEGENTIFREFTDLAGSKGSASVKVIRDTKKPVVIIASPIAGTKITASPVPVIWTVDGTSQTAQTSETLSAGDGEKTITRKATDGAGNTDSVSIKVILDKDKPLAPVMNAATSSPSPTMPATPTSLAATTVTLGSLAEGTHTLYLQESDDQGNWSPTSNLAIIVDRTGPALAIDQAAQTVSRATFVVTATATDPNGIKSVTVTVGTTTVPMTLGAKDTAVVTLVAGANTLTVTATDNVGNPKTASVIITYSKPVITITYPVPGFVTSQGAFTVLYDYFDPAKSTTTKKTLPVLLADGKNTVTVTDDAGSADPKSIDVYILSTVVFVRQSAPAAGDGTSWDNAYNDLAVALASTRGSAAGSKVWISAGTYSNPNESQTGFFTPAPGVSLYGGFPATGRPFTEAGRNLGASGPKTTLTNASAAVPWGGLLNVKGPATVDGLDFYQTTLGPEAIYLGDGNTTLRTNITLKSCQFRSLAGARTDSWMFVRTANATLDSCTFRSAEANGSLIGVLVGDVKITRSFIQANTCYSIALLDGNMDIASSTVTGNLAAFADDPPPDIDVQTGSLTKGAGVITDVPALLALP